MSYPDFAQIDRAATEIAAARKAYREAAELLAGKIATGATEDHAIAQSFVAAQEAVGAAWDASAALTGLLRPGKDVAAIAKDAETPFWDADGASFDAEIEAAAWDVLVAAAAGNANLGVVVERCTIAGAAARRYAAAAAAAQSYAEVQDIAASYAQAARSAQAAEGYLHIYSQVLDLALQSSPREANLRTAAERLDQFIIDSPIHAASSIRAGREHVDEARRLVASQLLSAAESDLQPPFLHFSEDHRYTEELRAAAATLLDPDDAAARDSWRSYIKLRGTGRERRLSSASSIERCTMRRSLRGTELKTVFARHDSLTSQPQLMAQVVISALLGDDRTGLGGAAGHVGEAGAAARRCSEAERDLLATPTVDTDRYLDAQARRNVSRLAPAARLLDAAEALAYAPQADPAAALLFADWSDQSAELRGTAQDARAGYFDAEVSWTLLDSAEELVVSVRPAWRAHRTYHQERRRQMAQVLNAAVALANHFGIGRTESYRLAADQVLDACTAEANYEAAVERSHERVQEATKLTNEASRLDASITFFGRPTNASERRASAEHLRAEARELGSEGQDALAELQYQVRAKSVQLSDAARGIASALHTAASQKLDEAAAADAERLAADKQWSELLPEAHKLKEDASRANSAWPRQRRAVRRELAARDASAQSMLSAAWDRQDAAKEAMEKARREASLLLCQGSLQAAERLLEAAITESRGSED
ncbi:MAG: hypothetical protein F4Z53_11540 [Acidimicrobiales bacterium]|nr:hypothetical protein [Acidimicrobiales bacterium]MYD33707.1 hypothetical protein [Acidimicrobiales bacterium]MYI09768.1 hypothetical protein [Acidimicrobiales bacterium]